MSHLSPTTLTNDEQQLILRATVGNLRDHTIISVALGTGLRLAEVVGLDVGDVVAPDGVEAGSWRSCRARCAAVLQPVANADLETTGPVRVGDVAAAGRFRPSLRIPLVATYCGDQRVQGVEGLVPGAEVCEAREPTHDNGVYTSERLRVAPSLARIGMLTG